LKSSTTRISNNSEAAKSPMLTIILYVLPGIAIVLFLIYATKKKWIYWKGTSGMATLTAFHNLVPKDKQAAIEIVMEEKAGKKMEEQESGEDKDPGEVENQEDAISG
jgi:hypothetical protein